MKFFITHGEVNRENDSQTYDGDDEDKEDEMSLEFDVLQGVRAALP